MTTVRKLSKLVPRPLSLVLGRTCRNVHVVSLPRLRFALYAVRFHGFRSGAPLGATRRHSRRFASGYSLSLRRSGFLW